MKYLSLLTVLLFLQSCGSENLSNSKAERILNHCLEKEPEQRTANFRIGKATFRQQEQDQELLEKYLKLREDGYLEMELLKEIEKGWRKGTKEYKVSLADDALEFMDQIPETGHIAIAKAFKYEVDEVLEVQEIPSKNSARVKVRYKAADITPFSIFSLKDPKEFFITDLTMKKTSNGWKYCDDFD
ncbi:MULTISPECIES: hypothetical protein [Flavobacteriaceae]|uniref:hypothetical protein n=1 Tax=Flavobacteriaceae TaxID=49546 RepID=UPI0014909E7D|nr:MULTISPECIES: hypothetical protein [Allomuricauda]MDC6366678.1 hypothetical protein [Muricauda sp. AC10]